MKKKRASNFLEIAVIRIHRSRANPSTVHPADLMIQTLHSFLRIIELHRTPETFRGRRSLRPERGIQIVFVDPLCPGCRLTTQDILLVLGIPTVPCEGFIEIEILPCLQVIQIPTLGQDRGLLRVRSFQECGFILPDMHDEVCRMEGGGGRERGWRHTEG